MQQEILQFTAIYSQITTFLVNYSFQIIGAIIVVDGGTDSLMRGDEPDLGTPAEDKKWVVYDGGHSVPRTQRIRESLAWLDRYLGP